MLNFDDRRTHLGVYVAILVRIKCGMCIVWPLNVPHNVNVTN